MRKRSIAFTVAAAAATVLAGAIPAQAHYTYYDWYTGCGWFSAEACGYGSVSSTHRTIKVCDTNADGQRPFAQYVRGGIGYTLHDPNGSKDGCGKNYKATGISKWRMCVDYGSYNVCTRDWISA
ncbi:hypothetical protein [Streptomyces gobiensis]|uniref:hypothetical protein n=1 Tax=Streptomyces gobiensis TaxID=2875706 RepID=UPI001E5AB5F5|nr:hypothetical protein [Streptomyces gobiensis]UGY94168.1 hypothetical protein test1122_22210 [Streptomyces gobiensis]